MNPERLVALVTGARTGIGRAVTEHLLEQGYLVVGCGRSACDWSAEGFSFVAADVSREADAAKVVLRAKQENGRLYALINCAATARMNHALLTPAGSLDDMLASNVTGTFLMSREAAKTMRKTGGRIVNVSSVAVPLRLEGQAAYVASKAAVERVSQVLARELAEFGITVNVIGATPIATSMIRGVSRDKMERLVNRLAIKRFGSFDDVTNVIDFFLRAESDAVTGQVIYLGGVPNA